MMTSLLSDDELDQSKNTTPSFQDEFQQGRAEGEAGGATTPSSVRTLARGGFGSKRSTLELFDNSGVSAGDEVPDRWDEDPDREMAWSRYFVKNYFSKYKWYNPRVNQEGAPDINKAWSFYEHVTLPRFLSEAAVKTRADAGEESKSTKLYPPLTSTQNLIEFGVGIDQYFSTIKYLILMLFIVGCINIPNVMYYASEEYSPTTGNNWVQHGSAMCSDERWRICEDCCDDGVWPQTRRQHDRRIVQIDSVPGRDEPLCLVLHRLCRGAEFPQGIINYVSFFFCLVFILCLHLFLKEREVISDEGKISASDYSVEVKNPPEDAFDPQEWKNFFEQFSSKQVTAVTIAINNEEFVQKLLNRRVALNKLRVMFPREFTMDKMNDETAVRAQVEKILTQQQEEGLGCLGCILEYSVMPLLRLLGMCEKPEVLCDRAFQIKGEIPDYKQKSYKVSRVFVTFETEEGQRTALNALTASKMDIYSNNTSHVSSETIFKDRVLRVREPTEPSAVRWLELSSSLGKSQITQIINFGVIVLLLIGSAFVVYITRLSQGPFLSSILITVFNSLFPMVVVPIMMMFEYHHTEGGYQTALYMKITVFRWVNAAVLYRVITPFENTIGDTSDDLILSVYSLLFSELFVTPLLRIMDISGNINKHYFGPRATTQEMMNLCFKGTPYNLGERYTDVTKVLFICFFYSSLIPGVFHFAAAIFIVMYIVDKYCLVRIWGWSANVGGELAKISRKYFFSAALAALAISSAINYAQFPYDRLCESEDPQRAFPQPGYNFSNVQVTEQEILNITVLPNMNLMHFCSQTSNHALQIPVNMQPEGLRYMTESQERLTRLYGWTALIAVSVILVYTWGLGICRKILSFFLSRADTSKAQDQHVDFSAFPEIDGYVPQVTHASLQYPQLACQVDYIDEELISWNDRNHSYDYHNLIFDALDPSEYRAPISSHYEYASSRSSWWHSLGEEGSGVRSNSYADIGTSARTTRPIFSTITHYPPKWMIELRNRKAQK